MQKITLIFIVAILGLSGCGDDGPVINRGSMIGFISLYDEFGYPLEDKSGVVVTISDIGTTATTDAQGKFTISEIRSGSYDITFSKAGYGSEKVFGVQLAGDPKPLVLSNISLYEMTTTELIAFDTSIGEEFEGAGYRILVSATVSPFASGRRSFIVFVNTSNSVSNKNYRFYKEMSIYHASGLADEILFDNEFVSQFTTGTQLHLIAYPVATGQEGYFDSNFGLKIFSTAGTPTDVKTITIP